MDDRECGNRARPCRARSNREPRGTTVSGAIECSRVRLIQPHAFYAWKTKTHSDNQLLLDLFGEDSQLNVYRGELEVRRPGAPTSAPVRDLVRPCEVRRAE